MAVHHFPPHYSGGAEWRTLRTASALQRRGHQVRVVAIESIQGDPADGLTWIDEIYEGVNLRRLSFNLKSAPDPFRWQYDNPWIGAHIEAMLRSLQPDLFHMVGGYLITASALRAAQRANIPTVVSLTDYWWICPRISLLRTDGTLSTLPINPVQCARCLGEEKRRFRLPGKMLPSLMQFYWSKQHDQITRVDDRLHFLLDTLNQVSAIICPSEFLRGVYEQVGIAPEKMQYIRQGRDFPGLTMEMKRKTPSRGLRLGFIGQIAKLKGVHTMIEAVRSLPNAPLELVIYGDLTAAPKYTAQLRQLIGADTRIKLSGTYTDLTTTLREIDVVIVPSLWYENSPNSILEAFAHCTPVITSDLGGMAELVTDGKNGMLFEPGNVQALAQKISFLLDDPHLLDQLRAGIGVVKSLGQEMDELERIYARLVA